MTNTPDPDADKHVGDKAIPRPAMPSGTVRARRIVRTAFCFLFHAFSSTPV